MQFGRDFCLFLNATAALDTPGEGTQGEGLFLNVTTSLSLVLPQNLVLADQNLHLVSSRKSAGQGALEAPVTLIQWKLSKEDVRPNRFVQGDVQPLPLTRICVANRRMSPSERPWKLLFLRKSYKLRLCSSKLMHRWPRK